MSPTVKKAELQYVVKIHQKLTGAIVNVVNKYKLLHICIARVGQYQFM